MAQVLSPFNADIITYGYNTNEAVWHTHTYTIDLENFGVKKLCNAHTSTKLKRARFFTMTILLSNN